MITISCPQCSAKLRVDPAFQGLTCRCTHCQSLLAIPSDAARMPIKLAPRPAPGARSGRSASSTGSASQLQDVYNNNSAPGLGVVQAPRQAPVNEPLISLETSRGGGGGGNQTAILAGAAALGALLLGIGVLLVVLIASRGEPTGPSAAFASPAPAPAPRSLFDTSAPTPAALPAPALRPATPAAPVATPAPVVVRETDSPHTWRTPTVLGHPFVGHTAILVDSVEQSRDWINDVNASLLETLSKTGGQERVSIFYVHSGRVDALPRQPLAPGRALRASLARLQRESPPSGTSGFYDGLRAALAAQPDHLMVITGRTKWQSASSYVLEQVRGSASKPSFTALSMSGPNADLESIATATGGTLEVIRPDAVRNWNR